MSSPKATPKPFVISIPDAELAALRNLLASTRHPEIPEEWGDSRPKIEDVKRLVARWQDGYDWREYEREINENLPQFTVDITLENTSTLNVHFVHKRSEVQNAIPLLFVHGWPGSFLEVSKILPLLTASGDKFPSFHLVTYSLPGFGFSQGCEFQDFSGTHYAEVGHKLMQILGYEQYVTQGGGWGYIITRKIAQMYGGRHCRATHANTCLGKPPTLFRNPILYVKYLFSRFPLDELWEVHISAKVPKIYFSYFKFQGKQLPTIAYAMADSPVALLCFIYEKLVGWTDRYPWTDDEILTWVSIYWFSRAGPADSLRIYFEATKAEETTRATITTPRNVAVGFSTFSMDFTRAPKIWAQTVSPNLTFWKRHSSGGYFAAYEKPRKLVRDLRLMFRRGAPAFGVVEGHTGY